MTFYICIIFAYFLILFNMSELKGNALLSLTMFITCEATGIMLAPVIAKFLSIKIGVVIACIIICVMTYL